MERLDAATAGLVDAIRKLVAECREDDVFRTATLALVEAEGRRYRRLAAASASLRLRPSNHFSGQFFRALQRATEHADVAGRGTGL